MFAVGALLGRLFVALSRPRPAGDLPLPCAPNPEGHTPDYRARYGARTPWMN